MKIRRTEYSTLAKSDLHSPPVKKKPLSARGTMTVLIVEDNEAMRQMIKKLIGDLTEAFTECSDGAQALGAYRQHHPDWVLMDIKMKEMDGLSATREIKAAFPQARIVIVTGYDDARLREAANMCIRRTCSSCGKF